MDKKAVKRRGGGRPNRGGGRQNRRGRGSVNTRPPGPSVSGRKGGSGLYDDDDMYDEDDDQDAEFSERPPPVATQNFPVTGVPSQYGRGGRGRGATGSSNSFSRGRGKGASGSSSSFESGRGRGATGSSYATGRGRGAAVSNSSFANSAFRPSYSSEEEYDELDHRAENQYWMVNNQMKLEDVATHAFSTDETEESSQTTVSSLAVKKLTRYGFDKQRSTEALQVCDGDLGMSLEYLLAECFSLNNSAVPDAQDLAEVVDLRNEEMLVLQSIYEDKFVERIPGKVWVINLQVPYLDKALQPKREKKMVKKHNDNREICRFYLKGFCKFGRRCKMKHSMPIVANAEAKLDDNMEDCTDYVVEIRFPDGNMYPKDALFVAFSSTSQFIEKHICLNITKHLIAEAKIRAENEEPSVFSVISVLDDEAFLESVVIEPPHEFSCPMSSRPWLNNHSQRDLSDVVFVNKDIAHGGTSKDSETDKELAEATNVMIKMTASDSKKNNEDNTDDKNGKPVEVKRSVSKEAVKKMNPAETLKANKRLIEDFKRKKTSGRYQSMQVARQKLPAWDLKDEILRVVEGNQVIVISGETGCGKTTQVPQFILDLYLTSGDLHLCNILCTQPRRISAMAVAERVADERADNLGRIVGYQIRLEKMQSSLTRLLFCTTGIVLRRLEGDTTLDGVTHLIIDEVHERSEESDFLLMYLRDMLPRRPDLKVILMSATLNAQLFSDYFGGCAVLDIPGRTFPVDQYFLEDAIEFTGPYARPMKHMNAVQRGVAEQDSSYEQDDPAHKASDRVQDQNLSVKQLFIRYNDYHKSTVKSLAMMDHTKINFEFFPKRGAILVFMPGYAEIQQLFDMLLSSHVFGRNRARYKIIPLHSTLSSEDQHAVFTTPPEGVTKIVIATNIAETSITIDDVCFVIDAGKMKEKRYDPTKSMESLEMVWVSRANALQRKGRAGRVQKGLAFHLFTSHRFQHHLLEQPIPEIQRAPLEQIVLRIRILDIFKKVPVKDVLNQLPEPPDNEAIDSAVKRLEVLGALNESGELTPLGYHLGTLPVDVRIGKLMLLGAIFRCLDPALTIAASLSFKSPFVTPFGKKHEADEKKLEFAAGNSDHLTMLNAYNSRGGGEAFRFCQDNFLSKKSLEMLASMKQQFVELLSDIGFVKEGIVARDVERAARGGGDGVAAVTGLEANLNCKNLKLVSALLVGALYPNIVQVLTPEQQYAQSGGGAVAVAPKAEDIRFKTRPDGYVKVHPSSVNFQVRYFESPYLVYHEKIKTTRIYIRDCTMVSVYPLLLFGGGDISVDLSRGNFILSVDEGWIRFMAQSHQIAELVRELRSELDQLLADKIENPHMDLCTCPRGSKIIDTIVKLITTQLFSTVLFDKGAVKLENFCCGLVYTENH
ncbi:DHX57-like protein [Mya arenaria]|uniref:DHX57-like protein n=1 Tax=Mya arenaria TaxID=6604 RepID=A0ABY7DSN2_MYAAR|nr:DHX57-like protein [Mya arenaria]